MPVGWADMGYATPSCGDSTSQPSFLDMSNGEKAYGKNSVPITMAIGST